MEKKGKRKKEILKKKGKRPSQFTFSVTPLLYVRSHAANCKSSITSSTSLMTHMLYNCSDCLLSSNHCILSAGLFRQIWLIVTYTQIMFKKQNGPVNVTKLLRCQAVYRVLVGFKKQTIWYSYSQIFIHQNASKISPEIVSCSRLFTCSTFLIT